ncbi:MULTISPECIES: hypothetical protein [unclassified Leifsonia]|uniref:hypothetical protein n=1 Tax=unclassified Leifsonia TaxID=2663824 RepID=UPI000360DC07|nr:MULTISPECIES: hypothetical protein [unclassified Leifsonia]TDP98895.1 hypothetical protein AXZ95_2800 [Leifsonia sp. 115AMFTsu3.1]
MSFLSGALVDRLLLLAVALGVAVLGFLVLRRAPRLAVATWIVVLCFVPIWLGFGIGFNGNYYLPPATAAALLVVAALLPVRRFRLSWMDALMTLVVVAALASILAGNAGIALGAAIIVVTYFVAGYIVGRVAPLRVDPAWVHGAIAVCFTIVAVLAIIEGLTHWNPFVLIKSGNSLYSIWGTIQERGGVPRAEGAFGHSIALGASLAMAVPITLAAPFRLWVRGLMVLTMLVATVYTFSRIGMICSLLGVALSVLFMRDAISRRARIAITTIVVVASAIVFPLVSAVFDDAGAEASDSADYRGDLVSLFGTMNLVGVAGSAQKNSAGSLYFGNFRSIDSQLILTGLTNGIIVLIAIAVALAFGILLVLRGKASPATIALVAQIPAFATVALITQYSIFVWFVAGLAATTQLAPDASRPLVLGRPTRVPQPEPDALPAGRG